MSANTEIAWATHTFNPVWGCTKVSAGCAHCYAETWAKRMGTDVWGPRERRTFGDKHWAEPLKWNRAAAAAGERHRVFCGSMCDIGEYHPTTRAQLPRLMELIYSTNSLDWLLLTKRPELLGPWLAEWLEENNEALVPQVEGPLAPRWWFGTSVEDEETAAHRIPVALDAPAAVHFVSYEPALGPVDFEPWLYGPDRIDWLIVGGESGAHARPFDLAWARSAVEQCHVAGVAPFVKQLGSVPYEDGVLLRGGDLDFGYRDRKGADPVEWPRDLRVRKMPMRIASHPQEENQ